MQVYGGLVVVICYAGNSDIDTTMNLITQSNIDILTQDSKEILVQVP